MEKRLFLAILLSFCVLYAWSVLVPRQKLSDQNPLISRPLINKEEAKIGYDEKPTRLSSLEKITKDLPLAPENPAPEKKENVFTSIETDKLSVKFKDVGGTIDDVFFKKYQTNLPISDIVNLSGYEDKKFKLVSKNPSDIEYLFEDETLKITKKYSFNNYQIDLQILIEQKNKIVRLDNFLFKIYSIKMSNLNLNSKTDQFFLRDRSLFEYVINSKDGFVRKNNSFQFNLKDKMQKQTEIKWVGFRDRYFCGIIKPLFSSSAISVNPINKERLDIDVETKNILEKYDFIMFFGPEDVSMLEKIDPSFKEIKRYYRNDLFDSVAKFIDFLMRNIYKIVPNWGVSIILIGLVVYFSMYPLTLKSFSSMRKMQIIQPKIAALKEKYKNNPQKMNQEMMEIYKQEKINPLGGCFPLLLQMPVFIGLYQVLWRNVSLKGARFLWIRDLSQPDRLFVLKQNLPFLGNEINILPILMIIVMFVQQKISTKAMLVTDPDQIAQQKMMAIVFPIMLGFVFYHMASGLNLYFTMFYLLSAFTQWKMSKKS